MHNPETMNTAARGAGGAAAIYSDGTYLSNNATWHVADSPWKARQIASMLRKHGITPGTLCEVGCGAGEILRQLSLVYPQTSFVGYELSPQAFELSQSRQSPQVRFFLKSILEEDASFDCLLAIDVFEHVEDYMGFVRSLQSKATYKIFHVPLDITVESVLKGIMLDSRASVGHLHYFTRESALATLTDCGYEIIDSFYTPYLLDSTGKSLRARFGRFRYRVYFSLAPHLTVRLFGGCSLLVLAR